MEKLSPFESVKYEILTALTGTPNKRIIQLIFKQYFVTLVEKTEVAQGFKYVVHYSIHKSSSEKHVWEFIHHKNN